MSFLGVFCGAIITDIFCLRIVVDNFPMERFFIEPLVEGPKTNNAVHLDTFRYGFTTEQVKKPSTGDFRIHSHLQ